MGTVVSYKEEKYSGLIDNSVLYHKSCGRVWGAVASWFVNIKMLKKVFIQNANWSNISWTIRENV